jgi:hypothetical protein
MLRMVFEVVMVLAVVGGMVFMMKVNASEDKLNNTLRENGSDNEDSESDPKSP